METVLADRFVLQSEIARGAVGVVWRAADRVTGDQVAVKILSEELRGEPAVVEGFFAEAEILAAIDHPGVVEIRDFVHTDEVLALVLELVEGPDLREHLRLHGPLCESEAALRCAAAAEALAAVHRAGFRHGDVKPGNLLLHGPDGVKFIDFGVARPAKSTTLPSHGTPEYTAPEIAAGGATRPSIDNYALGLVLYEALTGHSAYRGGSITEVLDRHLTRIPVKPAVLDGGLWEVVETLLALDPDRRGDLDQVAAELRRLAPELSTRASAPIEPVLRDRDATSELARAPLTPAAAGEALDAAEVPSGPTRSRRRRLALAGAGALLAAAAAAVLFVLPGGEPPELDASDPSPTAEAVETAEPTQAPAETPSQEPAGESSQTPGPRAPETDSGARERESHDMSDSEGDGSASGDSTEGTSVDEVPGSGLIGSRMPGN